MTHRAAGEALRRTMQLVPVKCEGCNAPIRVPSDVSFVTCRYCYARLEIDYSDERAEARLMQRLNRAAARVRQHAERVTSSAKRVEYQSRVLQLRNRVLRLRKTIDRIDERWDLDREQYMVRERGILRAPSAMMPIVRLLFATGVCVVGVAIAFWLVPSNHAMILAAVGFFLILYGLRASHLVKRAFAYRDALREYEHRRGDIEHRLALNEDDLRRLTGGRGHRR